MIKSRLLNITIVVLFGFSNIIYAFDVSKWRYKADVIIEDVNSKYYTLPLTPQVYNIARLDLGDIRLIDDTKGKQVPYLLFKPQDITEKQTYKPEVLNRSTHKDKSAMVTLDFGKQTMKNSIEVITSGNDFRRAVKIEGSNDNIEFFTLVERAYTFAVSNNKRFERIDLPANDYRYLKIRVWPMEGEKESPSIEDVRTYKIERKPAKRQPINVDMVLTGHSEDEKNNLSVYTYDLGYRNLQIDEISLNVTDDAFYRYVTVEGRDNAKRKVRIDSEDGRQRFKEVEVPWMGIVSDTIYRYITDDGKKHEKLVLDMLSGRRLNRYLRITIKNYDDKPIIVTQTVARMIPHNLIFSIEDNNLPTFYVGSESAVSPRYDLQHRLNNPSQIEAGTARLGDITDNPLFVQTEDKPVVSWTEEHKILLPVILVIVVVVLAGFILKSFKSMQNESIQK
jgi:hypothetical protein